MPHLTAQQKHDILIHCESRREGESEVDVAALHGATVTRATIWNWRQRWNHTPQSLKRREGSGATPILTPSEVSRHVHAPILAANRAHTVINYRTLLPSVRRKTGKPIALRTLQENGKKQLQIHSMATRKRTRAECQYTHTCEIEHACLCRLYGADFSLQCLSLSVTRSPTCDANSNATRVDTHSSSMRLHYECLRLQHTHSYSLISNRSSSSTRLLPMLLDMT